ncbi:MAG: SAV_6107 family HEPN domain-containing protein [Nakamurella sp.]
MVTRSSSRAESSTQNRGPGRGSRTSSRPSPSGPAGGPVGQAAARELIADAGRGLGSAIRATGTADRYAAAHLAGLRAAAALLAVRASPSSGRAAGSGSIAGRARPSRAGGRGNVWDLLERVAPELAEWAAFYRAGIGKRQLAEAGIGRAIGVRETDDLIRQTGDFIDLVESLISARQDRSG